MQEVVENLCDVMLWVDIGADADSNATYTLSNPVLLGARRHPRALWGLLSVNTQLIAADKTNLPANM